MARTIFTLPFILALFFLFTGTASAVAPTQEALEKWKAEGVLEQKLENWRAFKEAGGCSPSEHPVIDRDRRAQKLAAGEMQVTDTVNVVVLLVEFSDNLMADGGASGTPASFDSLLFSYQGYDTATVINPSGSMTDFYMENSYGQFFVKGDVFGPYMAPETYAYYVDTTSGLGRSKTLVQQVVNMADPEVDFGDYASDGINCDGLIIVHAGRGAEEGVYGIWSHKSDIGTVFYDSVVVSDYTMNPEEFGPPPNNHVPIGVFCHEYGHFVGLPDLYDITDRDGISFGLGRWSLMANGNYNGASKTPAHFDAWCKVNLGWVAPVDLYNLLPGDTNLYQAPVPAVEYSPVIYKLRNTITGSAEYWLVENRQRVGFDAQIPGAGLCIYHCDDNQGGSNMLPIYHVALEQADGNLDLEYTAGNAGDGGDTYPGATGNRSFHERTEPAALTNAGSWTMIGVWDVSNSDSVMYADFDITYSRPYIGLIDGMVINDESPRGDGDGIIEAGETIWVYTTAINRMRRAYNPRVRLETDNPYITFTQQEAPLEGDLTIDTQRSNLIPIEFVVADSVIPKIDSFFVTIVSDSVDGITGTNEFSSTYGYERQVGAAQILIVDDDRGASYQQSFEDAFYDLKFPSRTWTVSAEGVPSAADLSDYGIVFWNTGGRTSSPVFDAAKVAAMKGYLDNGGNLSVSSLSGIDDLFAIDSAFMADYFKVDEDSAAFWFDAIGVEGTILGDGVDFRLQTAIEIGDLSFLAARPGGEVQFNAGINRDPNRPVPNKYCGVTSNTGSYKTILLSFPADMIDNSVSDYAISDTLIGRMLLFFGGQATGIYDGSGFAGLPQSFELAQNYPNPFNPTTVIRYTLRATEQTGDQTPRTRLVVYNSLGQEVTTLVDKVQIPGTYTVEWDGTTRTGNQAASGLYFYRLERGDEALSKKMVLLK